MAVSVSSFSMTLLSVAEPELPPPVATSATYFVSEAILVIQFDQLLDIAFFERFSFAIRVANASRAYDGAAGISGDQVIGVTNFVGPNPGVNEVTYTETLGGLRGVTGVKVESFTLPIDLSPP